jgi:hypothetical protein
VVERDRHRSQKINHESSRQQEEDGSEGQGAHGDCVSGGGRAGGQEGETGERRCKAKASENKHDNAWYKEAAESEETTRNLRSRRAGAVGLGRAKEGTKK